MSQPELVQNLCHSLNWFEMYVKAWTRSKGMSQPGLARRLRQLAQRLRHSLNWLEGYVNSLKGYVTALTGSKVMSQPELARKHAAQGSEPLTKVL